MQLKSKLVFGVACCWVLFFSPRAQAAELEKGPYMIFSGVNTEMQVLWQADNTPANSGIEWGEDTFYGFASGPLSESGGGSMEHQFSYTITDLEPGTRYYYRVTVDAQEAVGSFMTAPEDAATSVTIYGYGDTRNSASRHNSVVEALMADVDGDADGRQTIMLHSGDWVNQGNIESDWSDQYFSRSHPGTLDFLSRVPVMGCRGNHEQGGGRLRKYWPYNYQDGSGCYYSFDYGPVHVAVVDQYVSFSPGSVQYLWLENDLANTQKLWKFVILHEPAWSAGGGHDNSTPTQQDLCPLFEQYSVAVVHGGHNHYYARCEVDGIQHITSGGGGGPLHSPDSNEAHVVACDGSLHFVRYEISGVTMTVTAIRDDGSLIDSFSMIKTDFVCPTVESQQQVGTLLRSDLDEASGIAASRQNPGVLWMHNDYPGSHPEDANQIYAVNVDGTILGTFIISVSPGARDPEDIAVGPGPLNGEEEPPAGHYIYWGDIGDNGNQYSEIWVKRIPEPVVDSEQDPVTVTLNDQDGVDVIRLQYPSGDHAPAHKDSETLLVDPLNGDIYVVTKRMYPNKVYRAPYPQATSGVQTMEYVATLPTGTGLNWITAGDISPDGSLIAVRNDGSTDYANIWYRPSGIEMGAVFDQSPCLYQINGEPQGEAIGWDADGSGLYTVSEAHHSSEPIWYYLMAWEPSGEQVTLIEADSVWKYLDDGSDQETAWREAFFDDALWAFGPAELGYGDSDEATIVSYGPDTNNKYVTTYFRRSFEVSDVSSYTGLDLSVLRDDGAVVYLNGIEVFRTHMPDGPIYFDTLASEPAVAGDEESTFFDASVDPAVLVEGTNVMAVEIHQQSVSSSDISFNLRLTGTRSETPFHDLRIIVIGRGETFPAAGSHTYPVGTDVSVYAYPSALLGYHFEGWIGGDVPSGHELDNPLLMTMDSSKGITARFVGEGEAMPWMYFLLY